MGFNPTNEQKKAIYENGNILISAAAGSGKTAVLVERVINKLTDKVNPVNADRLLIVTFTNAAAAEMRTRIEKRLNEECINNPDDIGLLKQKQLLNSAKICTIDSFCIDLVRENFEKCDVSPDFKMSDGYSLKPIDEAVLGLIINRYLEENDKDFLTLTDIIGAEYDESNFESFILRIFNYSRQMAFPLKWFQSLGDMYKDGKFTKDSKWYKYCFNFAKEKISSMRKWLASIIDMTSGISKASEKYANNFSSISVILNEMENLANLNDWDKFKNYISKLSFEKLPIIRNGSSVPEIATTKDVWSSFNDDLSLLNELFFEDISYINSQFSFLSKPLNTLSKILIEFDENLFKEYSEQNTYTFHNTEHLALSLLCSCDNENGEIIEVKSGAEEFLNRFDEVMVDEYQDTNDLQDMLFYVLSNKEKKLFAVGDVKQSIYGFRGANPKNFLNKKQRYIPIDVAKENEPKKIILGNNFRTRDDACDFINYFFKNFMTKETGIIEYNDEEKLIPSAHFPPYGNKGVDLDIVSANCDEKKLVTEAIHIADYIKNTISSGKCIRANDDELRNAKYSDFTILLRSTKNKASLIAETLRNCGIPASFSVEGYTETIEIMTMLSLIKIIDNPKSDIELLSVLMSPIFAFSADELALIRSENKKVDLYSSLLFSANSGNEKVIKFLKKLEKYRIYSVTLTLSKFISKLLYDTDYLNMVTALNDGMRRRNNLLMLLGYADQYVSSNSNSLCGFVKYIEKQSENGMKSASVTEGIDTVKIMSIHSSKGLQFPVCIIADMSTAFNQSDSRMRALYSNDLGIGFKYYDEKTGIKKTTVGAQVIINSMKKSSLEEEMRLLYVAFTRAQDKLMLCMSVGKLENKLSSLQHYLKASENKIDYNVFSKTNSYADWILLSAILHPNGTELRKNSNLVPLDTESILNVNIINEVSSLEKEKEDEKDIKINDELVKNVTENVKYEYPFEEISIIESKASASSLSKKFEDDKYLFSSRPSFMNKGRISPSQKGTAMHKVMQFINFDKSENVQSEIERLREWHFLSNEEANSIDLEKIEAFFKSDLFKKIQKSPVVEREMRFLTEVDAKIINPSLNDEMGKEKVIIQGAVDLCFQDDDKMVILDFKTDRTDDIKKLTEHYSEQLSIYSYAVEKIFEKKVSKKIIYSFYLSTFSEI